MKAIETQDAPAALGPYSQAVKNNGILYVSGQLGIDVNTGLLAPSFQGQAELVFENLKNILTAAGLTFKDVVKVSIFLDDMSSFPALNTLYGKIFDQKPYPARETIQVAKLPLNGAIEISLIAME